MLNTTANTYNFTLFLDGVSAEDLTPELENALRGVGCGDAKISAWHNWVRLDFSRTAISRNEAVDRALGEIDKVNPRFTSFHRQFVTPICEGIDE